MICKNCGKEIPDGAKFCGFCGALQTVEETAPEAEKAVPVENTEEKQTEAPVEEKEPEEPEEPKEEKKNTFQEKAEGVKEKVLGDNGKLDQGDFKRMGNEAASGIKSAASKVQWNQYKELLDVLKNPFELHDLSVLLDAFKCCRTADILYLCIHRLSHFKSPYTRGHGLAAAIMHNSSAAFPGALVISYFSSMTWRHSRRMMKTTRCSAPRALSHRSNHSDSARFARKTCAKRLLPHVWTLVKCPQMPEQARHLRPLDSLFSSYF